MYQYLCDYDVRVQMQLLSRQFNADHNFKKRGYERCPFSNRLLEAFARYQILCAADMFITIILILLYDGRTEQHKTLVTSLPTSAAPLNLGLTALRSAQAPTSLPTSAEYNCFRCSTSRATTLRHTRSSATWKPGLGPRWMTLCRKGIMFSPWLGGQDALGG